MSSIVDRVSEVRGGAVRHSNEGWLPHGAGADTSCVTEQTPANDAAQEEELPKLELVPALDEPDAAPD
jgi:hypothetical protein